MWAISQRLAGLGIGTPLVSLLSGKWPENKSFVEALRATLPPFWFYIGIVAAVAWVALRVVMQREDIAKRAVLAREYRRTIDGLYKQLEGVLAIEEPMPQILQIQKTLDDEVQSAINNRVWLYSPPTPPESEIEEPLSVEVKRIRSRFMARWKAPSPGAL